MKNQKTNMRIQMMKYTVAMGIIMLIVSQSKDMHLETRW